MDWANTAAGTAACCAGLLLVALGAAVAVQRLRDDARLRRLRADGLSAEAEVLEAYVSTHRHVETRQVHTDRRAVLRFRTADQLPVRVEDDGDTPRAVGDRVKVRYLPGRPEGALPADTVDRPRAAATFGALLGAAALLAAGLPVAAFGVALATGGDLP
ncbi:DUF3592 domain-containing protein [Kitasatospora phosalacinea]|uniref:DUF3592 domain-containing protein n=1 Tax=Kitasatospora phosalacinea TaxID=2065 RepID=A0A9W6PF61_9ACTN|nr:DUF3592 domain-containing protein [Kitasatospora phosalacinea]GLW53797.1 hypothetical protein Kpho01_18080 [Kitasatospora phosalacinea]